MKRVIAMIKPFKLDDVRQALIDKGIDGITVLDVRGIGRQSGRTELYRGAEYVVDFIPKVRLEVVIPDSRLSDCVSTIVHVARTGRLGDGKIFISEVEKTYRIRTGEQDLLAL
ncbi:MAG: P-II family nitrogen regulator [Succinivibrio sp.]|nr:P-II family nitrogen regulator [Succinivibrio sp.]